MTPLTDYDRVLIEGADPNLARGKLGERAQMAERGLRLKKFKIRPANLNAAALAQAFLFSLDVRAKVVDVFADLLVELEGPAVTAVGIEVGEDATPDADAYLTTQGIGTTVGEGPKGLTAGDKGVALTPGATALLAAASNVLVTVTAVGANVDQLVTGDVDVVVLYSWVP